MDFVKYLNENKDTIHAKPIYFEAEGEEGSVEVSMQWNTGYSDAVLAFANNINTHEGGTHLEGFKNALTTHDQRLRSPAGHPQGEGRQPHR